MRYFLIYLAWLGTWATSEAARYCYEQGEPLAGSIWVEAARFMIFLSIAIFAFLAADKRERTISYQVQIEHIVFIIGAKAIEHFFSLIAVFGYETAFNPYVFSIVNYTLATAYLIITPIRIIYLKNKAFWKSS